MSPAEHVRALATAVRAAVRPRLGHDREVVGTTDSGDATFALDQVAETAVERYIATADWSVTVFTEDGGLVGPADAEWLLVIDPIDGTRPAKAGLEMCCVSVAVARNRPGATLGDVEHAAVYEIKDDRLFLASRGAGLQILDHGLPRPAAPTDRPGVDGVAASVEITGRPIVPTAMVLEEVFERGSLRGGTFTMASSTFAMTRVVTGQLDCHLDVGQRVRQAVPELEPLWRRAGDGRIIALYVYDLAGVQLVAREAGLTVTDAWGRSLDTALLTEVSEPHHLSCVTASNPKLHAALMDSIERGITRLGGRWREMLDD